MKTWEEAKKVMIEKLDSYHWEFESKSGGIYGGEIYKDRGDYISPSTIKEVIKNADKNHPDFYMELVDEMCEWKWRNDADAYEFGALYDQLRTDIGGELFGEFEDEIREWCNEHIYFDYDYEDWNEDVYVNIFLDCGDANYEGTDSGVYNYYADRIPSNFNGLPEDSALRWLAIQQGVEFEVDSAIRGYKLGNGLDAINSKVGRSYIEEWQNLASCISALVFRCKMPLFDALKIKSRAIRWTTKFGVRTSDMPPIGTIKSKVLIDKDCECGLFDYGNGGGSLLDVKLVKQVEIPLDAVSDITFLGANDLGAYSVEEVYGCSGCDAKAFYIEKEENYNG